MTCGFWFRGKRTTPTVSELLSTRTATHLLRTGCPTARTRIFCMASRALFEAIVASADRSRESGKHAALSAAMRDGFLDTDFNVAAEGHESLKQTVHGETLKLAAKKLG